MKKAWENSRKVLESPGGFKKSPNLQGLFVIFRTFLEFSKKISINYIFSNSILEYFFFL